MIKLKVERDIECINKFERKWKIKTSGEISNNSNCPTKKNKKKKKISSVLKKQEQVNQENFQD